MDMHSFVMLRLNNSQSKGTRFCSNEQLEEIGESEGTFVHCSAM